MQICDANMISRVIILDTISVICQLLSQLRDSALQHDELNFMDNLHKNELDQVSLTSQQTQKTQLSFDNL